MTDMAKAAPNNSNTIETVVEVGIPMVLKKSSSKMSVIITAKKMNMISSKKKSSGLKMPFRATSIIPLEKIDPAAIPTEATIMMVLNEMALDPTAEFKKLTASLLTPTIKSAMASTERASKIYKNRFSIPINIGKRRYNSFQKGFLIVNNGASSGGVSMPLI